jgi:hypothetical protein
MVLHASGIGARNFYLATTAREHRRDIESRVTDSFFWDQADALFSLGNGTIAVFRGRTNLCRWFDPRRLAESTPPRRLP